MRDKLTKLKIQTASKHALAVVISVSAGVCVFAVHSCMYVSVCLEGVNHRGRRWDLGLTQTLLNL